MPEVAVVTGSTKGIGKQIGIELLKKGFFVYFNYSNDSDAAESLRLELQEYIGNYEIVQADLSSLEGLEILSEAVLEKCQSIDYLVLNAGLTCREDFEKITKSDWDKVIDANLSIPFFTVQKFSRYIRSGGSILFVGALMGIRPHAISIPYGVSKAGVHMLAQYLVKIFAPRNITVNAVAPGFVETPWQKSKEPAHRKRIEDKIALHRFGCVDEVAKACVDVMSNAYINGQTIVIDGGYQYE